MNTFTLSCAVFIASCIIASLNSLASGNVRHFAVDYSNNTFKKDGVDFRYISGSVHYFRIPEFYWRDRLRKAKACGLDAIETYIPWNFHWDGSSYDFSGRRDVVSFLKMVEEEGLLAIIRGFPYCDTEWDMGGLPSWLLNSTFSGIQLRTSDDIFMAAVKNWLNVILPVLKPRLYNNGGNIILMQVENEYGSYYARDTSYMTSLLEYINIQLENNVVLFTTDGNGENYLKYGGLPDALRTVDFGPGSDVTTSFALLRKYQKHGPLVNSEFYTGWLDSWGSHHHKTSSEVICQTLDMMLALGASVNFYMFAGGTNFAYWSGSNAPPIRQVTTSYDYDAPITENGDTTEKYFKIRDVIAKYKKIEPIPVPKNVSTYSYGAIDMENVGSFWSHLPWLCRDGPFKGRARSYEDIHQIGGYVLYSTIVPDMLSNTDEMSLHIENSVRDLAIVFVNKSPVANVARGQKVVELGSCGPGDEIALLVESKGRICYGHGINDSKGIDGLITLYDTSRSFVLNEWEMCPLDLESGIGGPAVEGHSNSPTVFYASIVLPIVADTFVDFSGGNWKNGYIIANGYNLGKFEPGAGPQETLYMPTPSFLVDGGAVLNIMIFESTPAEVCGTVGDTCQLSLVDKPNLGIR